MSSGYPSNQDQAGNTYYATTESTDYTSQKSSMTNLEIGVVIGTVIAFVLVLFTVFYCRHREQRRKANRTNARIEGGRLEEGRSQSNATQSTNESETKPKPSCGETSKWWSFLSKK